MRVIKIVRWIFPFVYTQPDSNLQIEQFNLPYTILCNFYKFKKTKSHLFSNATIDRFICFNQLLKFRRCINSSFAYNCGHHLETLNTIRLYYYYYYSCQIVANFKQNPSKTFSCFDDSSRRLGRMQIFPRFILQTYQSAYSGQSMTILCNYSADPRALPYSSRHTSHDPLW